MFCGGGDELLDFGSACVRLAWTALVPFSTLVVICLCHALPLRTFSALKTYISLDEAELLSTTNGGSIKNSTTYTRSNIFFISIGLLEALAYFTYFLYLLTTSSPLSSATFPTFLLAITWLYTVIRLLTRPTRTVPYDLFALYTALFSGAVIQLYDGQTWSETWLNRIIQHVLWGNMAITSVALVAVLRMPIALPGAGVRPMDIGLSVSPEDYTTLFGWITFSWVYPLVQRGRYTTLDEKSVWPLSPTMQSRVIFGKFITLPQVSLLRKLFAANSFDLILDFLLTLLSVAINYSGPFFLKRILDAIDNTTSTPQSRSQAYIYAILAFSFGLCKSEVDLQHLWLGRRASTRIRSELMASIYDKALKRKDFSGIVDGEKKKNDKSKDDDKTDDTKPGADVGKIINLMAGDANRVSMTAAALYNIYGAPFEIAIASVFLYKLLGSAAFAGIFVVLLAWPLNSYIARRSVRIQKGILEARDRRMGVLSELIGALKFIKFFAWEERWVDKVMEMRADELAWMVKARVNSVVFSLLWMSAPILISIISFFVYVVQGNQLTISTAFTAIALFNMVRAPLNVIPTWIVQILQTGVALNRIAVYLGEDEVSEQVSTLKKDASQLSATRMDNNVSEEDIVGLGIENGSFKWNEVEVAPVRATKEGKDMERVDGPVFLAEGPEMLVQYPDRDHRFELKDINVRFPERQLTVITGPTASGKTALLLALLGEMTLLHSTPPGRIIMSKTPSKYDIHAHALSISYAAQAPWLQHQSIRDNILFGAPFDTVRYNAVLDACALRTDLDILEDGDLTEIGARGVSLSGGQKARVALARAVYDRSRWLLLDDPLSAVDSGTAIWIVEKLLQGDLLAGRTVILVTHHVELVLPAAHYFVRMLDGRIDVQGTIEDLRAQGVLEELLHDSAASVAEAEVRQEALAVEPSAVEPSDVENESDDDLEELSVEAKKPRQLVKDEHREVGGVKWSVYRSYLKASSYWIWAFLALLAVIAQILGVSEKVWIMIWGSAYKQDESFHSFTSLVINEQQELDGNRDSAPHYHHHPTSSSLVAVERPFGIDWPHATQHPLFYVGIYAVIGLASVLTGVASMLAQYTGALRASRILFRQLLVTVVRATFRFHDTTPQGRILNRFGKDIETIDSSLAGSLQAVNVSLANFFASTMLIAYVFPWFFIPAIFIGVVFREVALGYVSTGRDLRRMESNTRSPIFSDFGELLEGIVTVRAFSAEKRFLDNLHKKIDLTTKMWYSFWMINRWLLLNFDVLGALAVLITSLFSIKMLADRAGLAGICITSAMAFTSSMYWACRFWTTLELDLNSVERVVEYLELPQEPPAIIKSNRAPACWPSSSNKDSLVVIEDLVIKYAPELPAVLRGVSFTLKAGERVGLLGRTGSGKSTLAMSILRFVDPTSGRIFIDGIDISKIGIHDLRSRLTFIPQEATLFSGTIRENLDPFNEYTDAECLDVLQRCHMINNTPSVLCTASPNTSWGGTTESIPTTTTDKATVSLETQVSAGGANFSQGQRQLIAIARALLRRNSIVVLDEATSSIDFATDSKIQATIREEFNSSLLLTVAHRLRTVIDYDRLIVLDKGQVSEFDSPWKLIQKEGGIFRSMCLDSGSFSDLEAAAKRKAECDSQAG